MITSHTAQDLLRCTDRKFFSQRFIASAISAKSLFQRDEVLRQSVPLNKRINYIERSQTVSPITPEYSQVFNMEDQEKVDSLAQDSGIGSTSDSNSSYSMRNKYHDMDSEDLSRASWFQGEMQR